MALMVVIAAMAAPSLTRTMRHRNLSEEARRFYAATEYARDEAVSQGVPMTVWVAPDGRSFGVRATTGFEGAEDRERDFETNADVQFDALTGAQKNGMIEVIQFTPEGLLANSSVDSVSLSDRFNSTIVIEQTDDGWGYEIVKEDSK